jgi:hypothetical protein
MNDQAINIGKKIAEWVGIAVAFGVIGSWWINTEVERRMNELAQDPSTHPTIVTATTKLETLEAGQVRIETKVDAFASQFLQYLERQAED